jgi:hypothetical protein
MTVKLNLTIDEKIVAKSKRYAAQKKTSVSKLVEELLTNVIADRERKKGKKSFVEKYAGTLKISIPDIEKAKDDYLKKKYDC